MLLGWRRQSKFSTAFVLGLVVCLFVFAIYLKASPSANNSLSGNSPTQVKFWVKSTASQNLKIKLAAVDAFVLVPPAVLALTQGNNASQASAPVSILPLKDSFAESGHWFRPPPRS